MKKRVLAITLAIMLVMAFIPFGPAAQATSGKAWIGGTFMKDDGEVDWVEFKDQSVDFALNELFTVGVDFGDEKNRHDDAGWGFISVVQTDLLGNPPLAVFIQSILVDGEEIEFDAANAEAGDDGGIRVSLTNVWADNPVVASYNVIGEFSSLEVTLAFIEDEFLHGNAWIGGTFVNDGGDVDWVEFKDQAVEITVGQEFTAVLDAGTDGNRHDDAGWGYITVVQTDLPQLLEKFLGATISSILVDGDEIEFNNESIEIGYDGGIRISLTN